MASRYPLVLNGTSIQELQSGDTLNLGFTPIDAATKGVANGVASLNSSGLVPAEQLPSYVDDVLEYANQAAFPGTGETGKIYVAIDTGKTYRWSGSIYVEINTTDLSAYLTSTTAASTYLTQTDASTTYLTQSNASSTYLTQSNASSTYLTQSNASSTYLTQSNAASTYAPISTTVTLTGTETLTGKTINGSNNTITNISLTTGVTGVLPVANGGTGLSALGSGVATWLSTPSSANLASAISDETGTGFLVFNTTPTITGLRETRVAIPASDIDLALGNYFTRTISGTTTLTVSNVPASGTASSFILELTNGGSATVNWWSGVKWAAGSAPSLTTSGRDVLGFYTHDSGTTWNGILIAKDIR